VGGGSKWTGVGPAGRAPSLHSNNYSSPEHECSSLDSDAQRFKPLSGEGTRALRGLALLPLPTLRAVLDRRWLIDEIDRCEARVASARDSAKAAGYGGDWVGWAVDCQPS